MTSDSEDVTIYCHTELGVGIGQCVGKLIQHGKGPLSTFQTGPFVTFLSQNKRKPRTLVASRANAYLVILRGTGYPDPPNPFSSQPGSKNASPFSTPQGSNAEFDKVFVFAEDTLNAFDKRFTTAFDAFINSFADHFIADYRQNEPPLPLIVNPPSSSVSATYRLPSTENGVERQPPSSSVSDFDLSTLLDERKRAFASKVLRPGQSIFRQRIIQAYEGRCVITGCNILTALEAAHIAPYCGPDSDHVSNGLLLRLDLHSLFDAFQLSIEPTEHRVKLGSALVGGFYEIINGRVIRAPANPSSQPNPQALLQHFTEFVSRNTP